jgi:hypothetical protein
MIQKFLKDFACVLVLGGSIALVGCGSGGGHSSKKATNSASNDDYYWKNFPDFSKIKKDLTLLATLEGYEYDGIPASSASAYTQAKGNFIYTISSDSSYGTSDSACPLPVGSDAIDAILNDGLNLNCEMSFGNTLNQSADAQIGIRQSNPVNTLGFFYRLTNGNQNSSVGAIEPYDASVSMSDIFVKFPPHKYATVWNYQFTFTDNDDSVFVNYKKTLSSNEWGFTCGAPYGDSDDYPASAWECDKFIPVDSAADAGNVYSVIFVPPANGDDDSYITFQYSGSEQ